VTDQNNSQNSAPQPSPYSQNIQPTQQTGANYNGGYVINLPYAAQYITFTSNGLTWTTSDPTPAEPKKEAKKAKKDPDGCTCKKCKEFYQFAEPNQEDGTLICYSCRTYG
jgi:hypothetical protein